MFGLVVLMVWYCVQEDAREALKLEKIAEFKAQWEEKKV